MFKSISGGRAETELVFKGCGCHRSTSISPGRTLIFSRSALRVSRLPLLLFQIQNLSNFHYFDQPHRGLAPSNCPVANQPNSIDPPSRSGDL
jgi:hypothetical protein